MRSTLAALFVLVSILAAFAANADATAHTSRTLPSVSSVLPDTLPLAFDAPAFDWQAHDLAAAREASPRTARTVRTYPSNAAATVDAPKVWTCGAPRGLATDATATVRACEYL